MKFRSYLTAAFFCFFVAALVSVALFLGGCSNASKKTTMSLPQTVDLTFSIPDRVMNGTEEPSETPFTVHVEQIVTLSGLDLVTDTAQTAKADGKLALPVGMGGSAPAANVAGELDQGDITANQEKDDSLENVGNPRDNSVNTGAAVVPAVGEVKTDNTDIVKPISSYDSIYTVKNIRTLNGRTYERFAQNATTPGSTFGGPVLVKWPEMETEFFVPDAAVDYRPNGSGGPAWACGEMSPAAESQGKTGGVWGPAGATYYEIHYNKK